MKKARLMLAAAAAGLLLAGCSGGGKSSFSPDRSSVYVTDDGELKSALVLETDKKAGKEELKQFLEEAVNRFNEKNGSGEDDENVPVALDSCTVENGRMTAVFDYRSAEDLIAFRQSDENEDNSNTFTSIEVKSASEAGTCGWFSEDLVKPDGSEVSGLDAAKTQKALAVSVQGGGILETEGAVICMSRGVETLSDTAVSVPEGQTTVIVFEAK